MRRSVPFPLRGIDSDSGGESINFHCYDWCKEHEVQFTRGRPYHKNDNKNDNAHIEQKNWTHVRKIFGWKRITEPKAIEMMNDLYGNELRLMLDYFQPSVKLIERRRVGSRVQRVCDKPKTPFERLIELGVLSTEQLAAMRAERDAVDPIALAAAIEAKVATVLRFASAAPSKRGPTQVYRNTFATMHPGGAARHAAQAAAPVRSNAAR